MEKNGPSMMMNKIKYFYGTVGIHLRAAILFLLPVFECTHLSSVYLLCSKQLNAFWITVENAMLLQMDGWRKNMATTIFFSQFFVIFHFIFVSYFIYYFPYMHIFIDIFFFFVLLLLTLLDFFFSPNLYHLWYLFNFFFVFSYLLIKAY